MALELSIGTFAIHRTNGHLMLAKLKNRIGHGPLAMLSGLAAYGSAELAVRIVRLCTVVIIARQLAPDIVGVAALSLTLFELIRVLANIGVGQRIIAAPADVLDATCNAARRLFWAWCLLVALVQCVVAAALAILFAQPLAGAMLAVLSLVYLFMPAGLVQCYLLMREGRAGTTARTTATQTIADQLLTTGLLLAWPSPWSIVLPKLLTAPIWLVMTRRARPWVADASAGYVPMLAMLRSGLSVLATDMLIAVRTQVDKLIIASTLGVSALGTYYFAFNAGIGIVSSLIAAFGTVIFPSLCAQTAGAARAQKLAMAAVLGVGIFVPIIAAQSLLAPFYVPLVFGAHWAHAAPLISILCLAGIPMLAGTLTTQWLRAHDRAHVDAVGGLVACVAALSGLLVGTQMGSLSAAALGWVAGLTLAILPFAAFTLRPVLSARRPSTTEQVA
jgi:O-antigen/teichoic acid export membrane protein